MNNENFNINFKNFYSVEDKKLKEIENNIKKINKCLNEFTCFYLETDCLIEKMLTNEFFNNINKIIEEVNNIYQNLEVLFTCLKIKINANNCLEIYSLTDITEILEILFNTFIKLLVINKKTKCFEYNNEYKNKIKNNINYSFIYIDRIIKLIPYINTKKNSIMDKFCGNINNLEKLKKKIKGYT